MNAAGKRRPSCTTAATPSSATFWNALATDNSRKSSRSAMTRSARPNWAASKSKLPERLVNVGIAEQNMVGVGAGLANGGRLPFVCGASPLSDRTIAGTDQGRYLLLQRQREARGHLVRNGLWRAWANPSFRSRTSPGLRVLPNLPVIAPCDSHRDGGCRGVGGRLTTGPVFLRLSRVGVPDLLARRSQVRAWQGQSACATVPTITLIANGTLTHRMLKAAEISRGNGASRHRVLNMATVRPIDEDAIVAAAQRNRCDRDGGRAFDLRRPRLRGCRGGGRQCPRSDEAPGRSRRLCSRPDRLSSSSMNSAWLPSAIADAAAQVLIKRK